MIILKESLSCSIGGTMIEHDENQPSMTTALTRKAESGE